MKSILVPVDQSESMPSALETGWRLAQLFGGTVDGVALRPAFAKPPAWQPSRLAALAAKAGGRNRT